MVCEQVLRIIHSHETLLERDVPLLLKTMSDCEEKTSCLCEKYFGKEDGIFKDPCL